MFPVEGRTLGVVAALLLALLCTRGGSCAPSSLQAHPGTDPRVAAVPRLHLAYGPDRRREDGASRASEYAPLCRRGRSSASG